MRSMVLDIQWHPGDERCTTLWRGMDFTASLQEPQTFFDADQTQSAAVPEGIYVKSFTSIGDFELQHAILSHQRNRRGASAGMPGNVSQSFNGNTVYAN